MNRRPQADPFGPKDRIAAFATATEAYAESLEDRDLANVYWGKSLGLWQALSILGGEDPVVADRPLRGPSATCGRRPADATSPAASPRRFVSRTGAGPQGW